jgi:hypothetical protein
MPWTVSFIERTFFVDFGDFFMDFVIVVLRPCG